jgi:hypothetical protein
MGAFMRVKALKSFVTATVSVALGEEVEMPPGEDWVRAGLCEALAGTPVLEAEGGASPVIVCEEVPLSEAQRAALTTGVESLPGPKRRALVRRVGERVRQELAGTPEVAPVVEGAETLPAPRAAVLRALAELAPAVACYWPWARG